MVDLDVHVWELLEKVCEGKKPNDLLFPSGALNRSHLSEDGHIRANNLRGTLYAAEKKLGLMHHTVHDLRHDGISYNVRRKIPPHEMSRFAGHRSVGFTMDHYYRKPREIDKEIIEKMSGKSLKKEP